MPELKYIIFSSACLGSLVKFYIATPHAKTANNFWTNSMYKKLLCFTLSLASFLTLSNSISHFFSFFYLTLYDAKLNKNNGKGSGPTRID